MYFTGIEILPEVLLLKIMLLSVKEKKIFKNTLMLMEFQIDFFPYLNKYWY